MSINIRCSQTFKVTHWSGPGSAEAQSSFAVDVSAEPAKDKWKRSHWARTSSISSSQGNSSRTRSQLREGRVVARKLSTDIGCRRHNDEIAQVLHDLYNCPSCAISSGITIEAVSYNLILIQHRTTQIMSTIFYIPHQVPTCNYLTTHRCKVVCVYDLS